MTDLDDFEPGETVIERLATGSTHRFVELEGSPNGSETDKFVFENMDTEVEWRESRSHLKVLLGHGEKEAEFEVVE